jgi:hypothetical protein
MPPQTRHPLATFLIALALVLGFASTASARVLSFSGAERPFSEDWASSSCANASRVKQVTTPVAQGRRAYDVTLKDGDFSFGERCEIGMGNFWRPGFPLFHEGDERWISFQVYLPDEYPIDTKDWNVFFQIHQEGDGGCPPLALHVENGRYRLFNSTRNTYVMNTREIWSAPAEADHWAKFTIHLNNSTSDDKGFVEMFGDLDGTGMKRLMDKTYTHTATKYANGSMMTNHARVGIYRNPAIKGDAHILFDGFTIATDRDSAEARAFASGPASTAPLAPAGRSSGHHVWLRASARHAGVLRLRGGARPVRAAAGQRVTIQVRRAGRWQRLTRGRVRRDGRFSLAARTGRGRVTVRAVVARVGHSRAVAARA